MILTLLPSFALAEDAPNVAPNVAFINDTGYATIKGAINAAADGSTIKIAAGTYDSVSFDTTEAAANRDKTLSIEPVDGAAVTINGGLSLGYDDSRTTNHSITVRNINFVNSYLYIGDYANVTVENCTFTGSVAGKPGVLMVLDSCDLKAFDRSNNDVANNAANQVTVRNCTFNGSPAGEPAVRLRNTGNVTITGNIIENAVHNGILMESNASVRNNDAKTINITGNTICNWNSGSINDGGRAMRLSLGNGNTLFAGSVVNITDNTFIKATLGKDTPDFLKITGAGAAPVDISNNYWSGKKTTSEFDGSVYTTDTTGAVTLTSVKNVCAVSDSTTLAEAAAAATSGETIKIAAGTYDITADNLLYKFKAGVTFEGAVDASGKPSTVFNVTLTGSGGLSIDDGATLKNMKFNVTSVGTNAEVFSAYNAFTMDNCEVVLSAGSADTAGYAYVFDMTTNLKAASITNCVFTDNTTGTAPTWVVGFPYANRYTSAEKFTFNNNTVTGRWNCGVIDLLAGSYEVKNNTVNVTGNPNTIFGIAVTPKMNSDKAYTSTITGNDVTKGNVFIRYIPIDNTNKTSTSPTDLTLIESVKPTVTVNTVNNGMTPCDICLARTHNCYAKLTLSGTQPFATGSDITTYTESRQIATGFVSAWQAAIGTTKYSTLAAAVVDAADGDTVKLLADVTLDSTVITPSDKSLTLDLNGHTITGASKKTAIICGGTLTIKDSGTTGSIKSSNVAVAVQDNAVLTIESGNLDSVEGAVITGYATGSTITINGGTFSASDNAVIAGNGKKTNSANAEIDKANTININGGTFNGGITTSGYVACGIYAPWKDTINVTGGTFNITGGAGIVARAGNVNISGGTFKTTGNVTGKVGDSRVVVPCSALVFDSEAKYYAMTNESKISVTGGYFNSAVSNVATVPTTDVARVSVSGGYFTSDPSAYVADGYYTATSDKAGYALMVKSGYAASITKNSVTTNYPTLAKAVAAAENGDTIKLLANVTEDITIPSGKTMTLDLNGKTLTGVTDADETPHSNDKPYKAVITNNGTLTVVDTASGGAITDASAYFKKATIYNTRSSTLNLLGGTISKGTAGAYYVLLNHGTATINGATVQSADTETSAILNGRSTSAWETIPVIEDASGTDISVMTITSGTVTGGRYAVKNGEAYASLNITGGTFSKGASDAAAIINYNNCEATISGGTFAADGAKDVISCKARTNTNGAGTTGLSVTGGSFSGSINVADGQKLSVSGGYFTSDPSAYVVSGKIAQTTTKTGYNFEVVEKTNTAVTVAPAPAEIATPQPSQPPAETAAIDALKGNPTTATGLDGAAGQEAQKVTTTAEQGAQVLASVDNTATAANTKIYEQPYLAIKVTDATEGAGTTPGTLTVNITPMVKTVASTAATAEGIVTSGDGKNAVQIGDAKQLTVTTPVTIKLPIPAAMAEETAAGSGTYKSLNIKHVKEDGITTYYYTANVTKEGTAYYATFTVTHGFSTFTLQAADTRTLAVDYDSSPDKNYFITDVGTTLPVPTKAGYTFTGWKFWDNLGEFGVQTKLTNDLWTTLMTGINPGATRNISATAQFSAIIVGGGSAGGGSTTDKYTLSFETNGGSAVKAVTAEKNAVIDLTKYAPTKEGYDFSGWYSDSKLTTAVTSVTMTKDITVYAKWTEKSQTAKLPFTDVPETAYYRDAVAWAVEKDVTSGATATTFAPDRVCTRAETVTFLWRAMGSPEPAAANNPFTDVSANDYYYKAVLWAVEKGITKGTSDTTFSPAAPVTRAQTVTFLWRAAGMPAQSGSNPFTDVQTGAFYTDAVLWAVSKGITEGTGTTTFSPNLGCTRAQIVTFLYRYLAK